jgi:hypothetical protein
VTYFLVGGACFFGGLAVGWKLRPQLVVEPRMEIHDAQGVMVIPFDVKTATVMSGWTEIPRA